MDKRDKYEKEHWNQADMRVVCGVGWWGGVNKRGQATEINCFGMCYNIIVLIHVQKHLVNKFKTCKVF